MRQDVLPTMVEGDGLMQRVAEYGIRFPKHAVIGVILMVALFAFEMFNFDTTRYALSNLLGPVSFAGLGWATILAIAFCAIDFAGLVRLFTPEVDGEQPKEVWYLMGAWLLGATMNALMTWWAVSLTLLNHDFGNEVLSREQLLQVVPIFVAVLVWLTRILFIGALTVAGEHLLEFGSQGDEAEERATPKRPQLKRRPLREPRPAVATAAAVHTRSQVEPQPVVAGKSGATEMPAFLSGRQEKKDKESENEELQTQPIVRPGLRRVEPESEKPAVGTRTKPNGKAKPNGRVRQRPPMPGVGGGLSASGRKRN